MKYKTDQAKGFNPITLTITMETPADALLIWATLGVPTDAVRQVANSIENNPQSTAWLTAKLGAHIADGTYPIWDDLDDRLRALDLLSLPGSGE